jgi:hypothetical protein
MATSRAANVVIQSGGNDRTQLFIEQTPTHTGDAARIAPRFRLLENLELGFTLG